MPGKRFQIGVYRLQYGSNNPGLVGSTADAAYEATLETSYNAIQVLIAGVSFSSPDRTDAAIIALLGVSNATPVSAATITNLGLSTVGGGWFGAIDWTAGLAACQA